MPNWTSIVRLLRRRLVLGIIFALSLTYCAISLLSHEKLGTSLRRRIQQGDIDSLSNGNDDLSIIDRDDDVVVGDGDEDDEILRGSGKHLSWQLEGGNDYESENVDSVNMPLHSEDDNDTSTVERTCRNSVQGKALIVDERGFVCARSQVQPTGCCSTFVERTPRPPADSRPGTKRRRYSCETCNRQGCCAIYEYCVSCCLEPTKRRTSKDPEEIDSRGDREKSRRGQDATKLRLRNLDRFQICLAACRTSSASVRHENTYKDPESKHCYTLYQRNRHPQQVISSRGNKEDNVPVVVTSSTLQ